MFACIFSPDARQLAESFSPWIEPVDSTTALFTITARQLPAIKRAPGQIAVATTAEAAILAARHLAGFTFIAPGEEARILGELPIDVLPPDPELFETFDLWGVRTLGDLAKLPEDGLAARLGVRGLHLQKLAQGALARPLKPWIAPSIYEESIELDYAIKLREPLIFLVARFLHSLTARLKSQSMAAGAIRLTLNKQERLLRLPFPTRDVKLLLKLAEHSLERQAPDEPVTKITLELLPAQPRRVQHGLFIPAAPEPEKLELTLGKIRGLVGEANVGYPKVEDTYRPGVGRLVALLPPRAFRHFRPTLDARVDLAGGVPKHLSTKLFRAKVLRADGPWRTSGEWWRPDSWDRDEWDLTLESGRYRLCCARPERMWFVEGVYD